MENDLKTLKEFEKKIIHFCDVGRSHIRANDKKGALSDFNTIKDIVKDLREEAKKLFERLSNLEFDNYLEDFCLNCNKIFNIDSNSSIHKKHHTLYTYPYEQDDFKGAVKILKWFFNLEDVKE